MLHEDVTDAGQLENYKRAYEFHLQQAERYKQLMAAVAAKYTTNLGQPRVEYSAAMAEDMKRVLKKKEDEI